MQPQSQQSQPINNAAQPAQAGMPPMPSPQPAVNMSSGPARSQAAAQSMASAPQQVPQAADDGDVIEKEWVERVRQIIAATAQDPYLQNKRLTELKAEYMQKRYGKTIKLSD